MNTTHSCLVTTSVALILLGCGSDPQNDPIDAPVAPRETSQGSEFVELEAVLSDLEGSVASEAVLHRFESGGDEVKISKFTGADASEAVMMRVAGSAFRSLVVDRLLEKSGPITLLETFLTLAPPDEVPHDALLAGHIGEAAALGREDDAIRTVNFDAFEGIEKVTVAACTTFAFPSTSGHTWSTGIKNHQTGVKQTFILNDESLMTTNYTKSAVCKANSSGWAAEWNMWSYNSSTWNYTPYSILYDGQKVAWYMPAGASRRYGAQGMSEPENTFHGRAGALVPN